MPGEQGQSPITEGTDVQTAANQIAGILDDDGHYNPNPDQLSRGHPDYDESSDERATPARDGKGRFTKRADSNDQATAYADDVDTDADIDQDEDIDELQAADDTDEDQVDAADDTTDADQQGTEGKIETLQEFADALEIPLDELIGSITDSFSAAGEDVTVTLAELRSGYQKDADYRKSTGKLAEDRRTAELDYANRMAAYEQANQVAASQMNQMEQFFTAQLNSDELNQLRATDPAEWTAKRSEIADQLQRLQYGRQQAAQHYHAFKAQQLGELKQRETERLTEKHGEFTDEHRNAVKDTLRSIGFGDDEISTIFDHRVVMAVMELGNLRAEVEQLRGEKTKAKAAVKQVKKDIPAFTQKGGKTQARKKGLSRDNVSQLRQRARKSGSVADAAKVIEQII